MSRELNYLQHPKRNWLEWAGVYIVIIAVFLGIFYMLVGRIRTHTLPTGQVELSVPYSKYLVGEPVSFTLTNNFNSAIYSINNCPDEPLGVYKLVNGKWVRLHAQADKECTEEDRRISIPANSSQTVSLEPWSDLFKEVGKYRLVVFVEYYNALPYQDIEIISPPPVVAKTVIPVTPLVTPSNNDDEGGDDDADQATYTVHVNSGGYYDQTNLTLHRGESIEFIYSPPYHDEVKTRFTPLNGSAPMSSFTLDVEHRSRTITFNNAGSWRFRAEEEDGNTGTITVL